MSKVNLQALAEFFDAHGSVGIYPQRTGALKVSLAIVKADPETLNEFRDFFGLGSVGGYPSYPPHKFYSFQAYSKNAGAILIQLLPFLKTKSHMARLAIKALSLQNGNGKRSVDAIKQLEMVRREAISMRANRPGKEYTAKV